MNFPKLYQTHDLCLMVCLGRNGSCLDSGYGTGVKTAAASATTRGSPVRRKMVKVCDETESAVGMMMGREMAAFRWPNERRYCIVYSCANLLQPHLGMEQHRQNNFMLATSTSTF